MGILGILAAVAVLFGGVQTTVTSSSAEVTTQANKPAVVVVQSTDSRTQFGKTTDHFLN